MLRNPHPRIFLVDKVTLLLASASSRVGSYPLGIFSIQTYTIHMKNIQIFTALIAVSFILIVGIVIRYTGAADVTATAEITNTAPVVDTIRVAAAAYSADTLTSSGILPTIGRDRTIHVNGQITDLNGEADIASSTLSLVFHKTTSTNACTADKNDCYRITTCATNYTDGDDTQISYNCEVPLAYWVDATDAASIYESDNWTAYVAVSDIATAQGTLTSTIEVNSLLALNLPEAIDYGTRSLGEISSSTTNVATILTQRGNTKADVEVSGTDMSCTLLGTIPVAAQKWSLTDVNHAAGTALTTSAAAAARNLDLRTDDASELTANLYWNIAIPATGVKGICSGSNTMAIIAQATANVVLYDGGPYDETGTIHNNGGYYRTVTIGTQTWMKDNLNAGVMLASGSAGAPNDGVIQKHCFDNSTTNCSNYGGIYNRNEAQQYSLIEGAQGSCPSGWHIPTDAEFKTLEIFLGMTQAQADSEGYRGTNQGTQLKVGGTSGFDFVLGGYWHGAGFYGELGSVGYLWTSTIVVSDDFYKRTLTSSEARVNRQYYNGVTDTGSIRCLKN